MTTMNISLPDEMKAFVDAQWLAEFDSRLAAYQAQLAGTAVTKDEADE